jgi:hypothetical protein
MVQSCSGLTSCAATVHRMAGSSNATVSSIGRNTGPSRWYRMPYTTLIGH